MNQQEIRSKVGQIRELAFKGTVPSEHRPKGAATHNDLFRTIMKIAGSIEDELDAEYRERQEKIRTFEGSYKHKLGGP